MRVFNWFFIVVFIIFAALQYNDPDPYIWVPIYLYAAFLCWLSIRKKILSGSLVDRLYWIRVICSLQGI